MLDLRALEGARSAEDAVRLYSEADGRCLYIAGGTIVVHKRGPLADLLVDLTTAGLDYIRIAEDGSIRIGAATRIADLKRSKEISRVGEGVLAEAASSVANHTIRNLATIGGNIVSWHFPTDLPAPLLVLDAGLTVVGPEGERELALSDFFTRRSEVFKSGDLVAEIRIPSSPDLGAAFEKIGRKRLDVSIVNAAAALAMDGDTITFARIATNGLGGPPSRVTDAERFLAGKSASDGSIREAARLAVASLGARDDHRASADYRFKIAEVAIRRALERATGVTRSAETQ